VPAHLVSHLCNDHLHSLGINSTLHKLRHRFGTQVLRVSGNLRHAQEALRHRSITSTQIYTQVTNIELAAAVAAVPRVATPSDQLALPGLTSGSAGHEADHHRGGRRA